MEDDFDDPRMAEALRRWAAKVRAEGGPGATVPDPAALQRELDRVDAEEARPGRIWRAALAVAACFVAAVSLGLWLLGGGGLPSFPGEAPQVLDVAVSPERTLVRGRPATPLPPGEPFFVHYFAETPGWAIVALVGLDGDTVTLTPEPAPLSLEDEPLGPFRAPADTGPAALLLATTAERATTDDVDRVLATVARAVGTSPVTSARELEVRVRAALAAVRGLRVTVLPVAVGR